MEAIKTNAAAKKRRTTHEHEVRSNSEIAKSKSRNHSCLSFALENMAKQEIIVFGYKLKGAEFEPVLICK